ncbi:hypothetical protein K435DRAFT_880574, partial [Dendrothele bispora CBS 962.96]
PLTPISPDDIVVKVTPLARPRPVGLNLRPLSLTPETLVTTSHGLPTPSLTPSPRSGLRSLSLTPSSEESMSHSTPTPAPRGKLSLSIQTSSSSDVSMATEDKKSKPIRRSSISYKRSSSSGLPTPEMTPTVPEQRFPSMNHHTSVSSVGTSTSEEDFYQNSNSHGSYHRHRPLSASEQHFLFKSHNALLSRIQDLERALSVRRESTSSYGSRPASTVSLPDSEASSSEPSDEMLRLVSDLKAERDELKRDVDGWRVRVGDLEKQIGVLGKRVDGERREAWVARSRVSVLEAEKAALEKDVQDARAKDESLIQQKATLEGEVRELTDVVKNLQNGKKGLEAENDRLKDEVEILRQQLRPDLDLVTPTPKSFENQQNQATQAWKRALSLDTNDSATDVDVNLSFDGGHHFGFSLKSVDEESEDLDAPQVPEDQDDDVYIDESEEEDGLAGYEDEEDSDLSFQSPGSSSSFGSEDEFPTRPRSVLHLNAVNSRPLDVPVSSVSRSDSTGSGSFPTVPSVPASAPSRHRAQASLSKTWTFPRNPQSASGSQTSGLRPSQDDVDKFFGCLDDGDSASDSSSRPVSPSVYNYENSKGLFVNAMDQYGDDEFIPFTLPPGVGIEEEPKGLEVVIEEEEEEEDFDEEETRVDNEDDHDEMYAGGIKITFTPPTEDLD